MVPPHPRTGGCAQMAMVALLSTHRWRGRPAGWSAHKGGGSQPWEPAPPLVAGLPSRAPETAGRSARRPANGGAQHRCWANGWLDESGGPPERGPCCACCGPPRGGDRAAWVAVAEEGRMWTEAPWQGGASERREGGGGADRAHGQVGRSTSGPARRRRGGAGGSFCRRLSGPACTLALFPVLPTTRRAAGLAPFRPRCGPIANCRRRDNWKHKNNGHAPGPPVAAGHRSWLAAPLKRGAADGRPPAAGSTASPCRAALSPSVGQCRQRCTASGAPWHRPLCYVGLSSVPRQSPPHL